MEFSDDGGCVRFVYPLQRLAPTRYEIIVCHSSFFVSSITVMSVMAFSTITDVNNHTCSIIASYPGSEGEESRGMRLVA